MKNILFDLRSTQPLDNQKFHGGGEYSKIIFIELAKKVTDLSCVYHKNLYLDEEIIEICKKKKFKMFDLDALCFQKVLDDNSFDLFYSGLPTAYKNKTIDFGNCKYLGTIHGLRDLEYVFDKYQLFYRNTWKDIIKYILNKYIPSFLFNRNWLKYDKLFSNPKFNVVVVSEHTKASLQVFYPQFNCKNIPVYYSPSTMQDIQDKVVEPYYTDKYWLIISGGRWLKNSFRAALAFDQLFSERPDIQGKVIITGVKNVKYLKRYLKNFSRFELLDYVDNIDLKRLYKGAYGFVYPTLNEGFGYPPLEAMKFGIPVLASSFSSIPEICRDAVMYFNPLSVSEIKNRIIQLEDTEIHNNYASKGIVRYKEVLHRQNFDLENLINYIVN
jgi:glycosyltransferase involved in cell wall biosynthesis